MDLMRTSLAPLSEGAWKMVRDRARQTLEGSLSARRIVDVSGPRGWEFSSLNLGRITPDEACVEGVSVGIRQVLPAVELRADFALQLAELDNVARGAIDVDLEALAAAAQRIARAEDQIVFKGLEKASIRGMLQAAGGRPVSIGADPHTHPAAVAEALVQLKQLGVGGPYALVAGDDLWRELSGVPDDDYPLLQRVTKLVGGPILLAPSLGRAGLLVSRRGGDFELTLGQDFTIGYELHDAKLVYLYLIESFTFRVLEPTAVVSLQPAAPRVVTT